MGTFLKYLAFAFGGLIVYYVCLSLGGLIFTNMSDSLPLMNGFYFSMLIFVCTAVIVDEIRKRKE